MQPGQRNGPKRRFERAGLGTCSVKVSKKGAFSFLGQPEIGLGMVNLSEAGMKLVVSQKLDPGAKIRAVIRVLAFDETVSGDLTVTRCAPNHEGKGGFVVGAAFGDIPPEQAAAIARLREQAASEAGRKKLEEQAREALQTRAKTAIIGVRKK